MPPKKQTAKAAAKDEGPPPHPVIFLEFTSSVAPAAANGEGGGHATPTSPVSLCRLEFELFNDVVPKTCENFKSLCVGAVVGEKKAKETKTCVYKGTRVLRMTEDVIQLGDVTHREDGKGQESIYGTAFEDEKFHAVPHEKGTLSMANSGPNTNGCQFFICLQPAPFLNPLHVSFGKLIGGPMAEQALDSLVEALHSVEDCDKYGRFSSRCPITLSACGISDTPAPSRTARTNTTM